MVRRDDGTEVEFKGLNATRDEQGIGASVVQDAAEYTNKQLSL
jgi:hypothetical protein